MKNILSYFGQKVDGPGYNLEYLPPEKKKIQSPTLNNN